VNGRRQQTARARDRRCPSSLVEDELVVLQLMRHEIFTRARTPQRNDRYSSFIVVAPRIRRGISFGPTAAPCGVRDRELDLHVRTRSFPLRGILQNVESRDIELRALDSRAPIRCAQLEILRPGLESPASRLWNRCALGRRRRRLGRISRASAHPSARHTVALL